MLIKKRATNENGHLRLEYFYDSAREAMYDLLHNMIDGEIVNIILLPGYIGWSPLEGSGILDPIAELKGLEVRYYKIREDLTIDTDDLFSKIAKLEDDNFAVLIVNYFGFVDEQISDISRVVKSRSGWVIEDNAHGFFTYQYSAGTYSDATFFSLHKMFPFDRGGSLVITNKLLSTFTYQGDGLDTAKYNPWVYDIAQIARVRRQNYLMLEELISAKDNHEYFVPLKQTSLGSGVVPQTFPIRILKGNRNEIYEMMNQAGYGVVSLYHTLISDLRHPEYQVSLDLSKCILNLPVHQDVEIERYSDMIATLKECCKQTSLGA